MGIEKEWNWRIECDTSGCQSYINDPTVLEFFVKERRQEGWSIGKTIKCPKCSGKRK